MRRPRVGNRLFLYARGRRIDRQVRKKWQIPGGMPEQGGGGMITQLFRRDSCTCQDVYSVEAQTNVFPQQRISIIYVKIYKNQKNFVYYTVLLSDEDTVGDSQQRSPS